MSTLFCTTCSQGIDAKALFCEHCGADLSTKAELALPTNPAGIKKFELPLEQVRSVFSNCFRQLNATLIFGTTLAGVFDFISPRVALLPVAATLATAGLITALLLRKFIAPGLQLSSTLRRALAPDVSLYKSPLLIFTGTLSALLVSGAAWSNASSAAGGVIASKFDAAHNAQLQLGVVQGLQKEQRVQTAVLEDIREGRTNNPRKELANQGILWTKGAFDDAVEKDDKAVVSLFLVGGMKWNLGTLQYAQQFEGSDISLLLLNHPKSLEKNNVCLDAIYQRTHKEIAQLRKLSTHKPQSVPRLSELNGRLLKLFCSEPAAVADVLSRIKQEEESYKIRYQAALRSQSVGLGPTPGTTRTSEECTLELSASNGLRIQNALVNYEYSSEAQWERSMGRGPHPMDRRDSYAKLMDRAKANSRFVPDAESKILIAEHCASDTNNISTLDDYNVQTYRQVYGLLN